MNNAETIDSIRGSSSPSQGSEEHEASGLGALSPWRRLFLRVRSFYQTGDPGHDEAHVLRVASACLRLGRELGADLDVLMPAAFLHDVVNVPKNSPMRAEASRLASEKARAILEEASEIDGQLLGRIVAAIEEHSFSRGLKPSSLESAILQDADRLDAIGAVGIMRTTSCGVAMGSRYYEPKDPFARSRELDDRRYTIDHFFAKLLKLEGLMNTEPARREAKARSEFMRAFLERLRSEIEFGSSASL